MGANARFVEIEDRCNAIEAKLAEAASRQAASLDRLCERHERVSQAVVALSAEDKQHQGQLQNTLTRIKDLEASLAACDGDTRDLLLREREHREGQVKRSQQALQAAQAMQIGELERKIGERLEQASRERERNVQE